MILCAHIPCRDCIFGSGIWSCDKEKEIWLESEADPEKEENKNDPVNHPSHYTDGKIEVIDYI